MDKPLKTIEHWRYGKSINLFDQEPFCVLTVKAKPERKEFSMFSGNTIN